MSIVITVTVRSRSCQIRNEGTLILIRVYAGKQAYPWIEEGGCHEDKYRQNKKPETECAPHDLIKARLFGSILRSKEEMKHKIGFSI